MRLPRNTIPLKLPMQDYTISKGPAISGFFDIKPVTASTVEKPVANAGPDQALPNQFSTTMAAILGVDETGTWSVESGKGVFADVNDPMSVCQQSRIRNQCNVMGCFQWSPVLPIPTRFLSLSAT